MACTPTDTDCRLQSHASYTSQPRSASAALHARACGTAGSCVATGALCSVAGMHQPPQHADSGTGSDLHDGCTVAEDMGCTCMGPIHGPGAVTDGALETGASIQVQPELRYACPCSSAAGHPGSCEADDAMHMMPTTAAADLSIAAILVYIRAVVHDVCACHDLAAACHHRPCNQLPGTAQWPTGHKTCDCRPAISHTLHDRCTTNTLLPPLNTHIRVS